MKTSASIVVCVIGTLLLVLSNAPANAAPAPPTTDVIFGQGYAAESLGSQDFIPKGLTLDAILPSGDGPFPAVVVVHGGSFMGGGKEAKRVVELAKDLSDEGFACFVINYRLTGDNPPAPAPWNVTFIQAAIHASFVDTKTAIRYVRANASTYQVDPDRIAVLGESAGAFAALAAGLGDPGDYMDDGPGHSPLEMNNLKTSSAVKAIVDLWGNAELIKDKFSAGDPPILIVHGKADFHIGTFYTAALNIEALCKEKGIPCKLYGIEGAGHGCFDAQIEGKPLAKGIAEWLRKQLG